MSFHRRLWFYFLLAASFLDTTTMADTAGDAAISSSIYADNADNWGPQYSIDTKISTEHTKFFHSKKENYPWLQISLKKTTTISHVIIVNRKSCCFDRLKNVEIRAGMEEVPGGATNQILTINTVCETFQGPPSTNQDVRLICETPIKAKFITIQLKDKEAILQINELFIHGTKPEQENIADLGYRPDCGAGWYDVQGQGVKNDYCRWVGNCGCRNDRGGDCSWWSCALAGSDEPYSPKGKYTEPDNDVEDDYSDSRGDTDKYPIQCPGLARRGFCHRNSTFMTRNCAKSCKLKSRIRRCLWRDSACSGKEKCIWGSCMGPYDRYFRCIEDRDCYEGDKMKCQRKRCLAPDMPGFRCDSGWDCNDGYDCHLSECVFEHRLT